MSALACPSTTAPPTSTVEALGRIAGGHDPVAWSWLIEHEGPGMFQVARRVLGSAAAADDACQEAFLHLRRSADRFRAQAVDHPEAAARAWLHRIAANAAAMHARAERRRTQRERAADVGVRRDNGPDGNAFDELRSALADLPDSQRQPLVLHHLDGQDYDAIGAALGISAGAARVRAHRGMESLRRRLVQAGVLAAASSLVGRLGASEAVLPADALTRWSSILGSTSIPAASTAAIFGGISIMAKITILGAALAVAAITTISLAPVQAEERHGDTPKAEAHATGLLKEAHDAMAEGTKGISTGSIVSLEKGKLVLRTLDGDLLFMPHWRGGMPKDGGGLDKGTLEQLRQFKAGDHVRIAWTWSERRRIESISAAQ